MTREGNGLSNCQTVVRAQLTASPHACEAEAKFVRKESLYVHFTHILSRQRPTSIMKHVRKLRLAAFRLSRPLINPCNSQDSAWVTIRIWGPAIRQTLR